jgi:transcriptional regulator with XRE-family HTH domain
MLRRVDKEELKAKRKLLRLSQAELADALGVAPNSVSRWEIGSVPIPKTVELSIEALECREKLSKNKGT